jgi:hypothetical protein
VFKRTLQESILSGYRIVTFYFLKTPPPPEVGMKLKYKLKKKDGLQDRNSNGTVVIEIFVVTAPT